MIISRSIHVAAKGTISFFLWLSNISVCVCMCLCVCVSVCMCMYTHHIFLTHLSVSGHLGCCHILDSILSNASNNWGPCTFGDEFCFELNEFEEPMGHPGENFHKAAGSQNLVFREQLELEIICNSCVRAKTMRCEWHDSEKGTLLKSRGQVRGPVEHQHLWSWWR